MEDIPTSGDWEPDRYDDGFKDGYVAAFKAAESVPTVSNSDYAAALRVWEWYFENDIRGPGHFGSFLVERLNSNKAPSIT